MKVLSIVGNRPQFIKSAPLSVALRNAGLDEVAIHTGQHYDPELSQVFFEELDLPEPDYRLGIGGLPHDEMLERMRPGLLEAIAAEKPDWVLVYGDTTSTLAGARAAKEAGVPLAHVEAGMRSGDWTMPEEHIRTEVDRLSDLLFCPDERSVRTLEAEQVPGTCLAPGDVMADATRLFAPIARQRAALPDVPGPYAVLTLHREGNTVPETLRRLIEALNATGWTFAFPLHPRTRLALEHNGIELAPTLHAMPPVGYLEMLALVEGSTRVVTDSGGLQKEAYWLRRPCITLRPSTEWADTVESGANTLVDPADPSGLLDALDRAAFPADPPTLYGDGHASERIAEALSVPLPGHAS